MARLPDKRIRTECKHRKLISPFDESLLQPCSYDLRLADVYKVEKAGKLPVGLGEKAWQERKAKDGVIVVYPHQFILGSTIETVRVGCMMCGQVSGRSSWARMGILVHTTANFVDPGFCGQLTLEIVNLGSTPVKLLVGQPIAQICFDELICLPESGYGDNLAVHYYQNQEGGNSR